MHERRDRAGAGGLACSHRHHARRTPPRRRARDPGPDEHPRARHPPDDRADGLRPHPQPVGPGALAGRVERRVGRGGRRGAGAGRARQRRRRLDPHPGLLLRPGRAQGQPGPHHASGRCGTRAASASSTSSPARCATRRRCSTPPADPASATPSSPRRPPRPYLAEVGADPGRLPRRAPVDQPPRVRTRSGLRPGRRAGGRAARVARPPRRGGPPRRSRGRGPRHPVHHAVGGQHPPRRSGGRAVAGPRAGRPRTSSRSRGRLRSGRRRSPPTTTSRAWPP